MWNIEVQLIKNITLDNFLSIVKIFKKKMDMVVLLYAAEVSAALAFNDWT